MRQLWEAGRPAGATGAVRESHRKAALVCFSLLCSCHPRLWYRKDEQRGRAVRGVVSIVLIQLHAPLLVEFADRMGHECGHNESHGQVQLLHEYIHRFLATLHSSDMQFRFISIDLILA